MTILKEDAVSEKISNVTEQRRHPRTAVGASFSIRLTGESAGSFRAEIDDLSPGGMTFLSDAALEKGMTLHLKLPTDIQIRGEVRSVGAPVDGRRRYGVRFHKIGYISNN